MFEGKTLLITDGIGSFGNTVLNRFFKTDIKENRNFSHDELKQDDMHHFYQKNYPEVSDKIKSYTDNVHELNKTRVQSWR